MLAAGILKEFNQRQAKEILDLFATHVAEGFYRRMVLTAEHYLKARQLIASMDTQLHSLDALHLSAAAGETITLLTADRDLAAAARRHKYGVNLIK
jgi:PIN domain